MAVNRGPKPTPATKADRRLYPEVDATAPGGMSQAELRLELSEYHGVAMDESRDLTWQEQISAVVQGRLDREAEHGRGTNREDWKEPQHPDAVSAENVIFAHEVNPAPVDDGLCPHGEDADLCEACEDALLSEDEGDYTEEEAEAIVAAEFFTDEVVETPPLDLPARIVKVTPENHDEVVERTERAFDEMFPDEQDTAADYAECMACGSPDHTMEDCPAAPNAVVGDDIDTDTFLDDMDRDVPPMPSLFLGMPGVLDYSFNHHAGTGPSAADRWMTCTASLGASRRFLERLSINQQHEFADGNVAARQGTTAHAAAEVEARVMLGEMSANEAEHELFELAINPPDGEDYTPEMAQFITEYTDLIGQYVAEGHEVLIEAKVLAAIPLTAPLTLETRAFMGMDEPEGPDDDDYYVIPGSVDCGVLPTEEDPVLTAIDLKYGEGKDVDPDSNPQVRIYMLALLALFVERGGDIETLARLDYVIAQPRLGGIKRWTESVDDLLAWRDEVLSPALTAALGLAPAEYVPGDDTCQWCPARGGCAALANARTEAAAELFTALDEAEFADGPGVVASDLDNERLASLLVQVTGLVNLQKDLKAEAQRRMYRGEKVPGHVLVNYTPPRAWKPDAPEFFADEDNSHLPVWQPPTLVTPTAFVKAMSKEFPGKNAKEREAAAQAKFAELIEVPDKRPIVAPESSNKARWSDMPPDQMFPDLPDEA